MSLPYHITMNQAAQSAHVAWGAGAVLLPVAKHWPHGQLIGSLAMVVFAAVKELWWDLKYEDLETSGGLAGGIKDLLGYCFGIWLANMILFL